MTKKRLNKWSNRCPGCNSLEIEQDELEHEKNVINETLSCQDCGTSFVRVYEYVETEIID